MSRLRHLLLVAASGVALLAAAGPAVQAMPQAVAAPQTAVSAPDLTADPALRTGRLPNGVRFAIMRNASPPGQAALRLRFDAGSLAEADDQKGLAHFLEHMAFNGSTNIPEGEMTARLERLGLSFGGDTNAQTGFDQTIYMLNLPNTSAETVETSLMVLRETASELLFKEDAIDRERGVIVGEERSRDTPQLRSLKAMLAFVAPGQRLADRAPIGDLDIIRAAPRDRFVRFYDSYYRPERATLIAVGDFDPVEMERQIRAAFGSWENGKPAGPDPDLGSVLKRKTETHVHVEPGAQSTIQLLWTRDHDRRTDSVATRQEDLERQLGLAVLNRRLAELARAGDPPILAAGASNQSLIKSLDAGTLVVAFNPGGWRRAIETAEQEQRRLVEFGVTQAEIDREAAEIRAALQTAAAGANTRQTPQLAAVLLNAVNEDEVFTSPADDLKLFDAVAAQARPETVNKAIRETFAGNGPLLFLTTPEPIEGGAEAVTTAFNASAARPVEAQKAVEAVAWSYTEFGAPTAYAREEIADLGVTLVRFHNGAVLVVKPTAFKDDEVLVAVRGGGGDLDLPSGEATSVWASSLVFSEGGLGRLTRAQVEQATAGRVASLDFKGLPDAYQLSGATTPADLTLQMQMLAAYYADAAWRPEPFDRIKGTFGQLLQQAEATPSGALAVRGAGLLADGDKRFSYPSDAEIAASTLQDLRDRVSASLASGPVEILIVGDVSVEDAIATTSATFGALPARDPASAESKGRTVRFPQPTQTPVVLRHGGSATQALGYVAWPTVDSVGDRREARTVSVLARVMQLRVTEELREKQGVAYSPAVGTNSSAVFPDYGYLFTQVETPPEALPGFFETVDRIAADLRDTPITADELQRARLPAVEGTRRAQATNAYWMNQLDGVAAYPARLDAVRRVVADLEAVTPEDVQRAARTYLQPDRAWRAEVRARAE